jgi:hypothetical protein
LKDSNASSKVKTTKEERIGVRSLIRNISGIEGRVGALGWGLRRMTNKLIINTNQTTSWLVCGWSTFDAQMSHGHSQDSP